MKYFISIGISKKKKSTSAFQPVPSLFILIQNNFDFCFSVFNLIVHFKLKYIPLLVFKLYRHCSFGASSCLCTVWVINIRMSTKKISVFETFVNLGEVFSSVSVSVADKKHNFMSPSFCQRE